MSIIAAAVAPPNIICRVEAMHDAARPLIDLARAGDVVICLEGYASLLAPLNEGCARLEAEYPRQARLAREYAPHGVVVVSCLTDDSAVMFHPHTTLEAAVMLNKAGPQPVLVSQRTCLAVLGLDRRHYLEERRRRRIPCTHVGKLVVTRLADWVALVGDAATDAVANGTAWTPESALLAAVGRGRT